MMKVLVFSCIGASRVFVLVLKKDYESLYYFYGVRRKILTKNVIFHVLNSGILYKAIMPERIQYIYNNLRSLGFNEEEVIQEVKKRLKTRRIVGRELVAYIYEVEI